MILCVFWDIVLLGLVSLMREVMLFVVLISLVRLVFILSRVFFIVLFRVCVFVVVCCKSLFLESWMGLGVGWVSELKIGRVGSCGCVVVSVFCFVSWNGICFSR